MNENSTGTIFQFVSVWADWCTQNANIGQPLTHYSCLGRQNEVRNYKLLRENSKQSALEPQVLDERAAIDFFKPRVVLWMQFNIWEKGDQDFHNLMIRKRIKKKEGINSAICQYGGLTRFQGNDISRHCAAACRNPITLPSGFNLVMACFKWLTSGRLPLRVILNLTCRALTVFSAKKNVLSCLLRNSITGSFCSVVITSTKCTLLNPVNALFYWSWISIIVQKHKPNPIPNPKPKPNPTHNYS